MESIMKFLFTGGLALALVGLGAGISRAAENEPPRKPQTPKAPFPYASEEVEFVNTGAGIRLAGTLTLPRSGGPHPAVVLVSGSGPGVRDHGGPGHRPSAVLTDHLTRQGIAVLQYDKRGCGQSEGNRDLMQSTMADFADDALAGVKYLRGRKEIDPKRVGLYGHSEGGSVVPLAASRSKDVAFIVLAGASVLSADQIILSQVEAIAPTFGESPEQVRQNLEALRLAFETLRAEKDDDAAKARLAKLLKERQPNRPQEEAMRQYGGFFSPYFRFHLSHDQPATIRKVRCPILVVNGGKDLLILEKINLAPMKAALKGHPDATVKLLPNVNHMLQTAVTGSPEEYNRIEETVSPEALKEITDWIRQRTHLNS
ncbi:MAG: alpha/beta hydrolase [Armatimonadetes bacterium]|nr:alpha/beta hydrolase [Armatimonadota bacterium]